MCYLCYSNNFSFREDATLDETSSTVRLSLDATFDLAHARPSLDATFDLAHRNTNNEPEVTEE